MDNSEFVNQYIDVATKNLHDLMGRNLISETKVALAEKSLAALKAQYDELLEKSEELQLTVNELTDVRSRYDVLVEEAQTLRVDYDAVRNDLGIARNQIAELVAANEELNNTIKDLAPASAPVETSPKKKTPSPKEL